MASLLSRIPVHFFRGTPTDRIIKYRGGAAVSAGLGASFWVFPWHTLVRIPQAELAYAFTFRELSSDFQDVTVNGEIRVRLDADATALRRDFSVDPATGAYLSEDPRKVEGEVRNALTAFVRRQITCRDLRGLLTATDAVRDAVWKEVGERKDVFDALGLSVVGIVVTGIAPSNSSLRTALEAEAREKMLAAADRAVHERRMQSATAERQHQEYTLATQQTLAEQRAKLIEAESANLLKQAATEAEASAKRLDPFKSVSPQLLFALAFQEAAKQGIQNLTITPELMASLSRLSSPEAH